MRRFIALLLALCLLTGCGGKPSSGEDLMVDIKPSEQSGGWITVDDGASQSYEVWDNALIADFALRLFRQTAQEGENTLISPMSVLTALAMTANGAQGDTLAQMESVLGQPVDALNSWYKYGAATDDALRMANGIWFKDDPGLTVEEDFLQTNADHYGAGVYKAPFDDLTLSDINRFVEEHTDGLVKDILDKIPEEAVMYLVNALAFEGKWQQVYNEYQVREAAFTTETGEKQTATLMYSEEDLYLENDLATGFLKPYQGKASRYAFAALLPKEGVSVTELTRSLSGSTLQQLLANPEQVKVNAAIPKFDTEYDVQLGEALKAMGMVDAFHEARADFSPMATHTDGNIYLSRVLHKTFLSVAEQGTRAGAATVVEAVAECALEMEIKTVTLDRPFLYMIVDTGSNTPIFIGALMHTQAYEDSHHTPAEPAVSDKPAVGYCGNIRTTVRMNGEEHSFMYDDSVALTDLLINLTYDPDTVCRCIAHITVETELGGPYYVNPEEFFVRCDEGQAALTEEQVQIIQDILNRLDA